MVMKNNDQLLKRRLNGLLPRIDIAGEPFIVDWRMKELRAEDDFNVRTNLKDLPMTADGEHYTCFYHIPSRSVVPLPEHLTRMTSDTVLLEIPYELKLDPVSVAREYGLPETALLDKYPIQEGLKARVIPLEETPLAEMVRKNRDKQEAKENRWGQPFDQQKKGRGKRK